MQHTVFVIFQHIENVAFAALFRDLAARRQCFVTCILQFSFQFIYLDKVLLTAVSIGNIYEQDESNEQKEPDLMPNGTRVENVSTQDLTQSKVGR